MGADRLYYLTERIYARPVYITVLCDVQFAVWVYTTVLEGPWCMVRQYARVVQRIVFWAAVHIMVLTVLMYHSCLLSFPALCNIYHMIVQFWWCIFARWTLDKVCTNISGWFLLQYTTPLIDSVGFSTRIEYMFKTVPLHNFPFLLNYGRISIVHFPILWKVFSLWE